MKRTVCPQGMVDTCCENYWRCGHGWLRGEQCEICNAPKREWVGLTEEQAAWCQAPTTRETWKRIEAALKEKNNG